MIQTNAPTAIVLVAGPVRETGWRGHHDYRAGCRLLADLLNRIAGVTARVIDGGWPTEPEAFADASAVLFYDHGGGKQGFLASGSHRAQMTMLAERGCGIAVLHQAAGFPAAHAAFGQRLLGGVYVAGASHRGHWRSRHADFPDHPVCRGVAPWSIRDGWLADIRFTDDMRGITPLVWSSRRCGGRAVGGTRAIVGWVYERPAGGRAFVFTGIDNHSAWQHAGLRRLVVNGLLWSAGHAVPAGEDWNRLSKDEIEGYLTPRRSPLIKKLRSAARKARRISIGNGSRW